MNVFFSFFNDFVDHLSASNHLLIISCSKCNATAYCRNAVELNETIYVGNKRMSWVIFPFFLLEDCQDICENYYNFAYRNIVETCFHRKSGRKVRLIYLKTLTTQSSVSFSFICGKNKRKCFFLNE